MPDWFEQARIVEMRLRNGIDHGPDLALFSEIRIESVFPERFRQDQRGSVVYVPQGIRSLPGQDSTGPYLLAWIIL